MSRRSLQLVTRVWLLLLFCDLTVVHFIFPQHAVGEIFGCPVAAVMDSGNAPDSSALPSMIAHETSHGEHLPLQQSDRQGDHSCFWNSVNLLAGTTPTLPLPEAVAPIPTPVPVVASLDRPRPLLFRPPRQS